MSFVLVMSSSVPTWQCQSYMIQKNFTIRHFLWIPNSVYETIVSRIWIKPMYFLFLQFGLYGSFLGCFLYILLGSCKDVPMGPTAIISLLTYQTIQNIEEIKRPAYAILLCFLNGCVEILMGLLGLGKSIHYYITLITYLLYGTKALEELWLPSNEGFFI